MLRHHRHCACVKTVIWRRGTKRKTKERWYYKGNKWRVSCYFPAFCARLSLGTASSFGFSECSSTNRNRKCRPTWNLHTWRVLSSGTWRHVVRRKSTDASEQHITKLFFLLLNRPRPGIKEIGFRTLSIVRIFNKQNTRRFGDWICLHPLVKGKKGGNPYSVGSFRDS
jgi:hypothetical protein